ncbi:MAG: DNA adenine methylase [Planctomycetes bacterium]|nr:DNA adenine methylase [Planctomycetota bacterium]
MKGPLKTHGGKRYLAERLVALMPAHTHYVEPFAGGLAVLFAKPPEGTSEVVNDLDGRFTNFWRVLQDEDLFARFRRRVAAIPFSEAEWRDAEAYLDGATKRASRQEMVERAARFFVLCRQSMAGRCKEFTPLTRNRTRTGMNEQASSWLNAVDRLPAVHNRLKRVVILNRTALDVIRSQDGPGVLFYLDPPYLPEVRAAKHAFGHFEMTVEQHEELLDAITGLQGMVMVSGYASQLYDSRLSGWTRHEFDLPNNAGGGKQKRRMTEVVWTNFKSAAQEVAA